jgi:hypothetical protein
MTKTGKDPIGYFARVEGALPSTPEKERDKAAMFVLSQAKDAEDAALLLDALGIDPKAIGTEVAATTVKVPRSTPKRRFK